MIYKREPTINATFGDILPSRVPSRTYPLKHPADKVGEVLKIAASEEKQETSSGINQNTLVEKLMNLPKKLPLDKIVPLFAGVISAKRYIDHRIDSFSPESIYKLSEVAEKSSDIPLYIKFTAEGIAVGLVVAGTSYLLIKYVPRLIARKKGKQ